MYSSFGSSAAEALSGKAKDVRTRKRERKSVRSVISKNVNQIVKDLIRNARYAPVDRVFQRQRLSQPDEIGDPVPNLHDPVLLVLLLFQLFLLS